jgi:putative acetyltransferase
MKATIAPAESPRDVAVVGRLFMEYGESLGAHICTASLADEVRGLPGDYARPAGGLWLARRGRVACGCVALRPSGTDFAELKRLYVQPNARRDGIGRALLGAAVEAARESGARAVVLETMAEFAEAFALYRSVGFVPSEPATTGAPIEMTLSLR